MQESGIGCLLLSLQICGETSPINPIAPTKLTTPATRSDETTIISIRNFLTFIPRLFALSSPAPIILRSQDFQMSIGTRIAVMGTIKRKSSHLAFPMSPTIQNIALFTASASAKYSVKVVRAWKKNITETPVRTIASAEPLFFSAMAIMTAEAISEKKKHFRR